MLRHTLARAGLGALVLFALLPSAQARTRAQITEEAKRQYSAQEYERAIQLLEPLLADPAATAAQKIDAYELIGLSHLILGDATRARGAFEKLLALDPQHALRDPSGSPKLRAFFEGVRESFAPRIAPPAAQLDDKPPARAIGGRVASFAVRLLGGPKDARWVFLYYRTAGETSFASAPYEPTAGDDAERTAQVSLPAASAPYTLEYYVEAKAASGAVLNRVGSPEQPLSIAVAAGPTGRHKPLYRRWWFWTLVGAAVAGGTVAVIVGAQQDAPAGNLAPRILQLPLSRP